MEKKLRIVRNVSTEDEEKICELYMTGNYTMGFLAQKYSCCAASIKKILEFYKIPIKTHPLHKNIGFSENYFEKIDSEEKAYFLGFIFSDGNVFKNQLCLEIGFRDKEILERFKAALNVKSKISYRKRKNTEVASIRVSSEKLCNDLAKYGIVPNKTISTKHLPSAIPPLYTRHFLRGVFDGDGWITLKKGGYYCMGYVCNFKSMAEDFKFMANELIEDKNHAKITFKNQNGTAYVAQFQSTRQVKQLATALYKDSNIHLTRKYKRAELIFSS